MLTNFGFSENSAQLFKLRSNQKIITQRKSKKGVAYSAIIQLYYCLLSLADWFALKNSRRHRTIYNIYLQSRCQMNTNVTGFLNENSSIFFLKIVQLAESKNWGNFLLFFHKNVGLRIFRIFKKIWICDFWSVGSSSGLSNPA